MHELAPLEVRVHQVDVLRLARRGRSCSRSWRSCSSRCRSLAIVGVVAKARAETGASARTNRSGAVEELKAGDRERIGQATAIEDVLAGGRADVVELGAVSFCTSASRAKALVGPPRAHKRAQAHAVATLALPRLAAAARVDEAQALRCLRVDALISPEVLHQAGHRRSSATRPGGGHLLGFLDVEAASAGRSLTTTTRSPRARRRSSPGPLPLSSSSRTNRGSRLGASGRAMSGRPRGSRAVVFFLRVRLTRMAALPRWNVQLQRVRAALAVRAEGSMPSFSNRRFDEPFRVIEVLHAQGSRGCAPCQRHSRATSVVPYATGSERLGAEGERKGRRRATVPPPA